MANGKKEATHSLRTEIQMLFSTQGATDIVDDINEISTRVENMTKPVEQLTKAFEDLNDSPLKNLVRTLKNFSIDSVNVDAGNLKKVLENKIASAIAKSKIEFIGDEGTERYPFKIKMGEEFWKKNQRNITEAMAKSFSNFVVDASKIPPLDNRMILEEFQKKFNEQIVELIKDEEVFSLYRVDPNTKAKKFKYKRRFTLDEETVAQIMGAIEREFLSVLSDPKNIVLEDIPKLNINSVGLKQAILKIQESIGDIDSLIGVEADALKDLPNIEDKLIKFRDNLDSMIRNINNLAIQLESITIGEATEEDVRKAIRAINELKEDLIIKINKWINDATLVLGSYLDVRPDLRAFKESITDLNNYFNTIFEQQMEVFKQDVNKVLEKLTVKEGAGDRDLLEGKKIDITQAILDIITENLLAKELPIELDTDLINSALTDWAHGLNIALDSELSIALNSISEYFTELFQHINSRIEDIFDAADITISMLLDTNEPLFKTKDLEKLLQSTQRKVYDYIVNALSNTVAISFDGREVEFKLPKSFTKDVKQIVDRNIRDYMKKIVEDYQTEAIDDTGVGESVERLSRHTTMIINAVMREVNQFFTDVRKEFLHRDSRWVESTKNIKTTFENNIKSLATSYIKILEDSVNTILLTDESLSHLRDQISSQVSESIKVKRIEVDKQATILELDGAYNRAVQLISERLRADIEAWIPESSATGIGELFDSTSVVRAIQQKTDQIISQYIDAFIADGLISEDVADVAVSIDGGYGLAIQGIDFTEIRNKVTNGIREVLQKQVDIIIKKLQEDIANIDQIDFSSLNLEKIVKKLDSTIEKIIVNRVERLALEQIDQGQLKINLTKSTQKALRHIERTINETMNQAIDSLKEQEIEGIELDIRTKRLQNNINSLIQKIINEKSKQITKLGNQLAEAAGVDEESVILLKESIDSILDNMILGYAEAAEKVSSQVGSSDEVNSIYTRMVNGFTDSFTKVIDSFVSELDNASIGQFSIPTDKIHPRIKSALADYFGVGVREFVKAIPEVEGKDVQKILIQHNVELITKAINDVIHNSVRNIVTSYGDAIKEVNIEPDMSLVEYIFDRLIALQDTVITRAKKMVRDQFKYLTEEIKQMNIEARSMGYRPTKSFSKEVAKATGADGVSAGKAIQGALDNANISINSATLTGTDVVAQGLDVDTKSINIPNVNQLRTNASRVVVDGQVVDLNVDRFPVEKMAIPIQNLLTSELPFSPDPNVTPYITTQLRNLAKEHFLPQNVFGRGYTPFDINKLLFKEATEPYKGLFAGITSNMAKYFLVGYMMRLPIKAVTEANQVAAKLDYHLAKARQNILIKDPQMTSVARGVVYDRYQAEGRDVSSPEFRQDVEKEAANLRNIMHNQMSDYLLNISKAYYQDIDAVGRYYSIVSRRASDPYEALTKTREIAKIAAVEEDLDTDFAATGLEAMSAQWGIDAAQLNRYTNMLLKTAMLSNVTVTDLLMTQRDTAAMFKSRLEGLDDEEAFAASMALSSMFVQATGKSGREAGTFWRNVLQRPYTGDRREFLEKVSQIEGFEMLSPYEVDETGRRVQKDFITMFSNILEATLKVDDPSAMTILSEIFPMRTIGGAESIEALVGDLKSDLERSIDVLKDMGEVDEDATLETVGIKEVIERYMENIMEVTEEDIGMYLAGLQDTVDYAYTGMHTQWQSTVYSIFNEMKEETTSAMTYLTAILRKFEENSHKLAEVIGIFMKIGIGYLGQGMLNRVIQRGKEAPIRPSDLQKEMASKYAELQAMEKSLAIRRTAVESSLTEYQARVADLDNEITTLQDERHQLHTFIEDMSGKGKLTDGEKAELMEAQIQRDMYDDQLIRLRNTYNLMESEVDKLSAELEQISKNYMDTLGLGGFLSRSMGARNVEELRDSFANYVRNSMLYTKVAPLAMRSTLSHSDEWYAQLHPRKQELEQQLMTQQREMFRYFKDYHGDTSEEVLRNILGEDFGDAFYALEHRLDEGTISAMQKIAHYVDFDEDFAKMRKNFDETYKELNAINSELIELNTDRSEVERAIFEAERGLFKGYREIEGVQVPIVQPKTTQEIIESYRGLLPAFGVNIDEFESGVDKLAAMFRDGKFDVDEYEDSLREVAAQLGISERDFEQFKVTVRELNNEIRSGSRAIFEYLAALEAVSTRSGRISAGATVGGHGGSGQSSSGLGTVGKTAVGVSALSLMGKEAGKKGLFGKLFSWLGATKIGAGLSKLRATKLGALGKGLGVGLKGLMSRVPKIALTYAAVSTIGSALGGLTERSMTDSERLSVEADKLESQINKASGWMITEEDGLLKKLGKWTAVQVGSGWHGLMNQINRALGGTAPSFGETREIWKNALKHPELTRDEFRTQMMEMYDVRLKRAEANFMRQQEYLEKNPFLDPVTGELRDVDDPYLQTIPLEELIEFLDKRMNELNKVLMESDALFTKEKVKLLISGISNNSSEMRKAIKEHLDRNIDEMSGLVREFKDYLPRLVPGTEVYTSMQLQILDLENRIADAELRKFETDFSEFDDVMERYNRSSTDIQTRYDIKKYDAILSGIHEDSTAIKQIEKRMADEQVKMITGIQNRLDGLKQKFADRPEQRERILIQIQQLEADKKRILADIKDKMSEGMSTFNLPSGLQPITYYEAMTRNNTHRNITVRSGDAVVNVNIGNMTGSDADIERLGRAVSNAVVQAQKNFVRQFANDVKSGMGNNYYSWNTY